MILEHSAKRREGEQRNEPIRVHMQLVSVCGQFCLIAASKELPRINQGTLAMHFRARGDVRRALAETTTEAEM